MRCTEIIRQITDTLVSNGAETGTPGTSQNSERIPLEKVTHIIANSIDFPDYHRAADALKAVVRPQWVQASLAKARLANPQQYSPDPRLFYSGLVVCCADLPAGDADAIIGGVIAMGGLYSSAVTKQVTHIVALTLEAEKCRAALSKGLKCSIVLPHWFDDCLKLGRRIDEGPYRLPDPDLLHKDGTERVAEVNRQDLQGASMAQPRGLPCPESQKLTVFQNKKVMLCQDLDIGSRLLGVIEDLIVAGGGSVTGSVHKADFFICQYRDSLLYRIACRAGKDVGNLSWLYHLIRTDTWSSPMRRLLHYPVSRSGLPGFKHFKISLSNYNGEARIYLENLARAAGSEFTRTMKEDNTHLITAHTMSEKCEAAKEWSIHMINHLWLEESYAKWQVQSLTNPRYTQFPSRTNLGEVVGQTPIDRQAAERFFYPLGSDVEEGADSPQNLDLPPSSSVVPSPLPRVLKTPARLVGKENGTPSTTGSRSAKAKAVSKIHDLASDIALYQKEQKRVGGVTHGGRREQRETVTPRKRSTSCESDSIETKKPRGSKQVLIRLVVSGYKAWAEQGGRKEFEERARLRELGVLVVADHSSCTHLAAPRIVRTQKFICAVAAAPKIISTKFIEACLAQDQICDPNDFLLQDREHEKMWNFRLADALKRAESNAGKLLQGRSIYCTEDVRGGFDTYKSIVETNGGTCRLYRARAVSNPGPRDESPSAAEEVHLMSGTTPGELKLWPKFKVMAEAAGLIPFIVSTDWLLNSALCQTVLAPDPFTLSENDAASSAGG